MADDVREVVHEAERQGWRVEQTKKHYWKCYAPDGKTIVVLSSTPSDSRSTKNGIALMRKAGFKWKGR